MEDSDTKKGQDVVPAKAEVLPPSGAKSTSFTIAPDGKGGVTVSMTNKPDDKKKMPRGSTAFRHA